MRAQPCHSSSGAGGRPGRQAGLGVVGQALGLGLAGALARLAVLRPLRRSTAHMASGTFYGGATPLGSVVGKEGIGRTGGGERVYFDMPVKPYGSLAERALVDAEALFSVPEGVADELAVAFGVAGLAAWLSLEWKAQVRDGDTVLVLGASGVVGRIAVQAAKLLGAGHVVAAARSEEGLSRAGELGADAAVKLDSADDLVGAFRDAAIGGIDVIIDPLWGEPAAAQYRLRAQEPGWSS